MESQRNLLVIGLLFVSFLIYQQWQIEQNPPAPVAVATESVPTSENSSVSSDVPVSVETQKPLVTKVDAKKIKIITDLLNLEIDTRGGDVIHADLLKYNNTLNSKDKFTLLKRGSDFTYIAQSGLMGKDGIDSTVPGRPIYQANQSKYIMAEGDESLTVPLTFITESGISVVKNYIFKRDSYVVDVQFKVINNSQNPVSMNIFSQIKESISDNGSNLMMPVYRGGAFSTHETRYEKYSYDDMQDKKLNKQSTGGWVAMLQHYFVTAWLPNKDESVTLFTKVDDKQKFATIGYKSNITTIGQGQEQTLTNRLWVGPKQPAQMDDAADNLGLTSDYGWLWFISKYLFMLLNAFHSLVGNWGLAIICITFTVKGVMYPLTKAQYTSMAKMRLLQPKMAALKERFGDDKQKMSAAMMEMYKKEKVNPLGGCLPILLQMPIFIALYYALMESVELRQAPFMLWIEDLSVMDPYYILPALMGASMFMIQKMSPTTVTDPMQQKVMQFMPVIFTVFFIWFPAGLVLYWLVSNIVTLIQQWIIFRSLEKKGLHSKKK